jgi:hypothetical protein
MRRKTTLTYFATRNWVVFNQNQNRNFQFIKKRGKKEKNVMMVGDVD